MIISRGVGGSTGAANDLPYGLLIPQLGFGREPVGQGNEGELPTADGNFVLTDDDTTSHIRFEGQSQYGQEPLQFEVKAEVYFRVS